MKRQRTSVLIAIIALLAAIPAAGSAQTGPEALIARARSVVMTPDPGREAITRALVDALDASLLILPRTDQAGGTRSRIEGVKKIVEADGLFSDEAYRDLGLAYGSVSGGTAWTIPEELKSVKEPAKGIDLAVKICGRLLDSALAAHKAGRSQEAVRDLLGMVILVVTPIEK
ncbi:MAG: hypothetical protein ABFD52_02035 [Acidobacteriota bacterium]